MSDKLRLELSIVGNLGALEADMATLQKKLSGLRPLDMGFKKALKEIKDVNAELEKTQKQIEKNKVAINKATKEELAGIEMQEKAAKRLLDLELRRQGIRGKEAKGYRTSLHDAFAPTAATAAERKRIADAYAGVSSIAPGIKPLYEQAGVHRKAAQAHVQDYTNMERARAKLTKTVIAGAKAEEQALVSLARVQASTSRQTDAIATAQSKRLRDALAATRAEMARMRQVAQSGGSVDRKEAATVWNRLQRQMTAAQAERDTGNLTARQAAAYDRTLSSARVYYGGRTGALTGLQETVATKAMEAARRTNQMRVWDRIQKVDDVFSGAKSGMSNNIHGVDDAMLARQIGQLKRERTRIDRLSAGTTDQRLAQQYQILSTGLGSRIHSHSETLDAVRRERANIAAAAAGVPGGVSSLTAQHMYGALDKFRGTRAGVGIAQLGGGVAGATSIAQLQAHYREIDTAIKTGEAKLKDTRSRLSKEEAAEVRKALERLRQEYKNGDAEIARLRQRDAEHIAKAAIAASPETGYLASRRAQNIKRGMDLRTHALDLESDPSLIGRMSKTDLMRARSAIHASRGALAGGGDDLLAQIAQREGVVGKPSWWQKLAYRGSGGLLQIRGEGMDTHAYNRENDKLLNRINKRVTNTPMP